METTTFILPTWCIGPLFNDDYSALNDDEVKEISDFMHKVFSDGSTLGSCVDMDDDKHFAYTNDLNNMGGDVATFTFIFHPTNKHIQHENHC